MTNEEQIKYSTGVFVPDKLWTKAPNGNIMYSLKLKDGSIVHELFIRDDGLILGKAVGGRREYEYEGFNFQSEDIIAIKHFRGPLTFLMPWFRL